MTDAMVTSVGTGAFEPVFGKAPELGVTTGAGVEVSVGAADGEADNVAGGEVVGGAEGVPLVGWGVGVCVMVGV